ncbi:MAG: AAA family ATPase [Planctomycetes bacterium]|nr:AAA family ATPase [Planctomycetota bacterium]
MTTTPYQLRPSRSATQELDERGVPLPKFQTIYANGAIRSETLVRQRPGPRRPTRWLWQGRIPRGQVTLIEGELGVGKSLVVNDLIARVTRALPWPLPLDQSANSTPAENETENPARERVAGRVLVVTRQDDAGTLDGQLADQGVDLDRVVRVDHARSVDEDAKLPADLRPLQLPFDIPMLRDELRVQPDIELIVIDPLSDFCETPKRVAQSLRQLNDLARQTGVAIVVTLPARSRFEAQGQLKLTSRYRTEEVRCVWCVAIDPADLERRLFLSTRMNACKAPQGLAFTVEAEQPVWHLQTGLSAIDPLARDSAIRSFLASYLTEAGEPVAKVYHLGAEMGFTPTQMRAVGKRLGVQIVKAPGFGKDGSWLWCLASALQERSQSDPREGLVEDASDIADRPDEIDDSERDLVAVDAVAGLAALEASADDTADGSPENFEISKSLENTAENCEFSPEMSDGGTSDDLAQTAFNRTDAAQWEERPAAEQPLGIGLPVASVERSIALSDPQVVAQALAYAQRFAQETPSAARPLNPKQARKQTRKLRKKERRRQELAADQGRNW